MRVIGAQRLAEVGLAPEQINAFGRWGCSKQMAKYARDALAKATAIAKAIRSRSVASASTSLTTPSSSRYDRPMKKWMKLRAQSASGRAV